MFDFGFSEMLVVGVVALVVLGLKNYRRLLKQPASGLVRRSVLFPKSSQTLTAKQILRSSNSSKIRHVRSPMR